MLAGRSHGLGCTAAGTSGVPDLPSVRPSGRPRAAKTANMANAASYRYQCDAFDLLGSESIFSECGANLGDRVFSDALQACKDDDAQCADSFGRPASLTVMIILLGYFCSILRTRCGLSRLLHERFSRMGWPMPVERALFFSVTASSVNRTESLFLWASKILCKNVNPPLAVKLPPHMKFELMIFEESWGSSLPLTHPQHRKAPSSAR